jgi:hypothetical protein
VHRRFAHALAPIGPHSGSTQIPDSPRAFPRVLAGLIGMVCRIERFGREVGPKLTNQRTPTPPPHAPQTICPHSGLARILGFSSKYLICLVSAEVLPLSCQINHLAFANCLTGALIDNGFFPNPLTRRDPTANA